MPLPLSRCCALLLLVGGVARAEPPPVRRATVETRAEAMFARADGNRNGWLDRDEYRAAVLGIARHYDPKVPPNGRGMAAVMAQFDALDPTRSGRIPRTTFVAAALAHFDGADLNHDGIVTPDEARRAGAIKQKALNRRR